CYQYYSGNTF
nr:immunoglobulin light chain junction region [Macaca mulatta]